jgi:cysteine synthase A
MFALEWCEFCWALRKFFASRNIPFRSVDLDSVAYQKDNLGGELRAALYKKTGSPTIPQVFVGGEHIGGCTETFDFVREGRLQSMLEERDIAFNSAIAGDPYDFLPKWVHPR